jgi:carbonic anhydrase/acetyltransferase-like protein (isoleucine patch superfamily)
MLMKALLICPHERPGVALLAEKRPLAAAPVCGRPFIEYWLEYLAMLGARSVVVLASDRPEEVRAIVGDGRKWGLHAEVIPETHELSIEEARAKYQSDLSVWLPVPTDALLMDRLPNQTACAFDSYEVWFNAIQQFSRQSPSPTRIGLRELQPGVWVGLRPRISPNATLRAPCWLGDDVHIGAKAVVGPNAVVENRSLIESGAEIMDSVVAPETFVGAFTEVRDSVVIGNLLINWRNGSHLNVPDAFLLGAVTAKPVDFSMTVLLGRILAAVAMVLTAPFAAYVCLKCAFRGQHPLREMIGVRLAKRLTGPALEPFSFYEFTNTNRWARRWPQLWSIVTGDLCWVGNRPISTSKAGRLRNEFERLWLHAPVGLVSLADVRGWVDSFSDEARAHSAFYAVQRDWRLDLQILYRAPIVIALTALQLWENQLVPLPMRQWLREEYPTKYRL